MELRGRFGRIIACGCVTLFDLLITISEEGFCVAMDLLGMYAYGRPEILEEFIPQIKLAAENSGLKSKDGHRSQMDEHHFQDIMKWILRKGRGNVDARSIASILSNQLVNLVNNGNERLIKPLVPLLLSDFPEISWQIIGPAITSDIRVAWKFEHLLGDKYSFRESKNPPILSLPEETLFPGAKQTKNSTEPCCRNCPSPYNPKP